MKCASCGANIYDDANRCQYCGAYQPQPKQQKQTVQPQQQQPVVVHVHNTNVIKNKNNNSSYGSRRAARAGKSKGVALFLCIFLGYFGAHKFYLGKTGAGILYLLTVGLFGLGWFFDIFSILFGGARDKWGYKLV